VSDDRLAVLRDCTLATNGLPGDVAELGVFRGGTAKLIGHFAPGARLHLFDTFTGIPEDDAAPAGHHRRGDFPSDVEDVRRYLSNPNAIFRVGVFPATAPRDGVRFRLVHIDGDILQTTEAALDWFGRRMVPGGIIVLDDFEWENCPGVATAVRERFAESRIEVRAKYQAVVRF
jgi:O-methyltransferase